MNLSVKAQKTKKEGYFNEPNGKLGGLKHSNKGFNTKKNCRWFDS